MVASGPRGVGLVLWRPPEDRRAAGVFTDVSCSPGAMIPGDGEVRLQQSSVPQSRSHTRLGHSWAGCSPWSARVSEERCFLSRVRRKTSF